MTTTEFIIAMLFVLVLIIVAVAFLWHLDSGKKSSKEVSLYVHEAGNNEITDKDDSDEFYNFKVTIFDSTGNIIKEEVIKCQDYEYDEDSYVFYSLDENEKDHYIYVKGNFIVHVDEL